MKRQTMAKRLRAKLREVKATLMRCRHRPVPQQGHWLRRVVQGYLSYHAVPGNMAVLEAFRAQAIRHWLSIPDDTRPGGVPCPGVGGPVGSPFPGEVAGWVG